MLYIETRNIKNQLYSMRTTKRFHSDNICITMEEYKKEFINFMIECGALKFGSFTLKSGRKSPFFMNTGAYVTGSQILQLGKYYAEAVHNNFGDEFDVLFGPAYKGIPLAVSTAIAYSELYGKAIRYCSNRKELKDHGDSGSFLGSKIKDGDRIVIIEDVTTSGKSIEETYPLIRAQESTPGSIKIVGEIISLNRMERAGIGLKNAADYITEKYGFPVCSIVTMEDVISQLYTYGDKQIITEEIKSEIDDYYAEYGAK